MPLAALLVLLSETPPYDVYVATPKAIRSVNARVFFLLSQHFLMASSFRIETSHSLTSVSHECLRIIG